MSKPISFGELDFKIVASVEETRGKPEPETPFRIAILGDFSGRAHRGIVDTKIANRKPLLVDRDNINDVMKKLGVEINLQILKGFPPVNIKFSEMDDFHPDSLFEKLEIFEALRDTREGIKDPLLFASIVKDSNATLEPAETPAPEDVDKNLKKIFPETTEDLLSQVIEETESNPLGESKGRGTEFDRYVEKIVKPHLVPDIEPQQTKIIEAVDSAAGELMRMVLHHLDFQAMESAWRSVYFLVSRLETDEKLKLYLIDISKDELAADLSKTDDLRTTDTFKLLVEQTVETFGGEPWALLAGSYSFNNTVYDAAILGRMAKIAKSAGAPFITAAEDSMLGCESLANTPRPENWTQSVDEQSRDAWHTLRKMPEAAYLGLALPRFILRPPYGEDTDAIDSFEFEEMPDASIHSFYLWGNPSVACALLLGQSFSRSGWDLQPGAVLDIDGLPLHVYKEGGESMIKPCAEVVFTEQAAETIIEKGIMPLLSFKSQDMARLARFQSIADPPTGLNGRWG